MSTLKQLVDETTNIKNELIACHTDLKNSLTKKGIKVLETDKMLNLIVKISNIKGFKVSENPTQNSLIDYQFSSSISSYESSYTITEYCKNNGSNLEGFCNISILCRGNSKTTYTPSIYIFINDKQIEEIKISNPSNITLTKQYYVNEGDIVSIRYKTTIQTSSKIYLGDVTMKYYLERI